MVKKIIIPDEQIQMLKNLTETEKHFFAKLSEIDLEKTILDDVSPIFNDDKGHGTNFFFMANKDMWFYVILEKNEDVSNICIQFPVFDDQEDLELDSFYEKDRQLLLDLIWSQLVSHFRLQLRLTFISNTNPWTFN